MKIALFFFLIVPFAFSVDEGANVSVGIKTSLLGFGMEGAVKINKKFRTRLGVNYFTTSRIFHVNDIKYAVNNNKPIDCKATIRLFSVPLYLDFHPFETPFGLTAGILYNGNEFTVSATPTVAITYNGTTYANNALGTIEGKASFQNMSGFLGLRYDSTYHNIANFSFNAEVGILIQSAPKFLVQLKNSTLQRSNLNNLLYDMNRDVQNIKIPKKILCIIRRFPIIGFGFKYRF